MLHPVSHLLAFPFLFTSLTAVAPAVPEHCSRNGNNYKLALSILVLIGIIVSYLPQSAGRCLEGTLGIAQLFVQFVLFTLIFALYMMYFPPQKKVNTLRYKLRLLCLPARSFAWSISLFFAKIIAGNFVVSAIITMILLAFVCDMTDHHSIWALLWAGFLGITSVFLTMIQYIPQIVETYLRKSVGALSISMMLMQTPGAILMTISLAHSPGANWSTWVPYAVAAFFQAVLLGMCVYYRFHTKRLGLSSFHTAETAPLLAGKTSQKNRAVEMDQENGQALEPYIPKSDNGALVDL
ncbi:hypothetical protein BGX34_010834 [Mortierella sp. NVP85]|nr:hypothetical protein BGX34_010834 [Mortierella sp. NVP85]